MKITLPSCKAQEIISLNSPEFESLRIGSIISGDSGSPLLETHGRHWLESANQLWQPCWQFRCLKNFPAGEYSVKIGKNGWTLAVITLSDKGSRGLREDTSGPLIVEMAQQALSIGLAKRYLIADDASQLKTLLTRLALFEGFDLIVSTGGTGVSERDITPQVTNSLLDMPLPGIAQAMMQASLAITPFASISRASSGLIGRSLIINLPGSAKAAKENLGAVLPALSHALAKINGDTTDCGAAR